MSRKGARRKIAEGIYEDAYGLSATVKVGGKQAERRYPPGTALAIMQAWREKTRVAERTHQVQHAGHKGTLQADATRYLRLVGTLASIKARRVEVRAWVTRLGPRLREAITAEDVLLARVAWQDAGSSPKTINNRVQTLRHLYHTLDGKKAPSPCDEVSDLHVAKTPAVFISADTVIKVEATLEHWEQHKRLPDAKTRARFRVYASCGKRPSEIMRAEPPDVDMTRRVWIVRDAKGGHSPGVYLNDDMVAAWELFIAADAWGKFDTNSFARTLRGAGWQAGVKPYNLRHTTWITASERGADLSDIQQGAGHKHISTTRKHYVPVLSSRMQKMSELLDGRFHWGAGRSSGGASRPVDK